MKIRAVARLAASVALLGLAACSSAPAPAPGPRATPQQVAPPAAARELEARSILLLLADRRMYDERSLSALLGASAPVREALAVALGRIGDPRGRSLLQGLLVDTEPAVRRAAAFALGELGAREAERALVVAAVDDDAETGALAVEALGKIGAPLAGVRRALGALEPVEAWARLAPPLYRFKEPATVDAAKEGLAESDPEVRRGAAFALAREPRPEGLEALRALVADADPAIRAWAARGLGIVGGLDDLPRLLARLDDDALSVRIQAVRAGAALLARSEALAPLDWGARVAVLLGDRAQAMRAAALEAAGRFLPHPDLERALRSTLAGGEPREQDLALAALVAGRVADRAALITAAAGSPDRWLRARAAGSAAKTGDRDLLEQLIGDPEPAVRAAALGAMAELGGEPGPLLAALADRDPTVRATALEALGEARELPTAQVAAAIDAARADGAANDVRLAGIRVLRARAEASPAERPAVVEALSRLGSDADWLVRREAADALGGLGEPRPPLGPVETRLDLAAYRQVVLQTARPVVVEIATSRGSFTLELACPEAPMTCLSFLQLARRGFFDGTSWHRVVPDFVVQGGDPRGDGWGGPGYTVRDEVNRLRYRRGAVGMALSGPETGGSQFFVTLSPQPHLDGVYTVFGRVTAGLAVVDELRQGDRIVAVRAPDPAGTASRGGSGALR